MLEGGRHDRDTVSVRSTEMGLWKGVKEKENER